MDNSEFRIENKDAEVEISLWTLCKSVFKRLWILILVAAIAGSFAFFSAKSSVSSSYSSSYTNYFYVENNRTSSTDVRSIMQVYYYVATNDDILERVSNEINVGLSVEELKSMINVDLDEKNTIVTVSVKGPVPEVVYAVADKLNTIAANEITSKIEQSHIETLVVPSEPVLQTSGENPVKAAVMAGIFGFILTAALIVIIEIVQDKVKNPAQLEDRIGIVVFGSVPESKKLSRGNV